MRSEGGQGLDSLLAAGVTDLSCHLLAARQVGFRGVLIGRSIDAFVGIGFMQICREEVGWLC